MTIDNSVTTSLPGEVLKKLILVNSADEKYKRIVFTVEGAPNEYPLATKLSDERYRIESPMFFQEKVGCGDIVAVKRDSANEHVLLFDRIIERGDRAALVSVGEFHRPEMQRGLQTLSATGVAIKECPDFLAVLSMTQPFSTPDILEAFDMEDAPILFVAPPGPWMVPVFDHMANGRTDEGTRLIEEKRREFTDGLQIVAARLKTGEWVSGDQVDLRRN